MAMQTERMALVLGATGGVGGEMARALLRRGWTVRALHREPEQARTALPGASWVRGDAMDRGSVVAAASGVSTIIHAVNPPGYRGWGQLVLPMIDNTIAAAAAAGGARVVLPGTVYNFGPDAGALISERSPQNPLTRKGRIRVELERRMERAQAFGVRGLVVRAGDFFGPRPGNSWFSQGLVAPGKPVRAITYPGAPGLSHSWAYLPDVGETAARLLEMDAVLAPFAVFHMRGHRVTGHELAVAVARSVGAPSLPIRSIPWPLLGAVAPFNETLREMMEMRYLWRGPLDLDNRRLVSLIGEEPHTPLDDAVRAALDGIGCLAGTQNQPALRSAFA